MPDDVVLAMRPDMRTAVIALTHDPKLDDLALMAVLKTDASRRPALSTALHIQIALGNRISVQSIRDAIGTAVR